MKGLDDPDPEKAAEAAKTLAEYVNKEGLAVREEVLRAGLFAHLWKQAKQGKLGWEDKWYNTIDSSKLSFKDELGSGAFAIVYKVRNRDGLPFFALLSLTVALCHGGA
jgi:hypothetical protein